MRAFAALVALLILCAAPSMQSGGVQDPAWSPDGRWLAFSFLDQIWIADKDGGSGRPLIPDGTAVQRHPAWSPDARSIAFAEDRGTGYVIVVVSADGGPRRVISGNGEARWPSWTKDGRVIFSRRQEGRWRLFAAALEGKPPSPLFSDLDDERQASVSPDGKQVAFISDRETEDGDVDLWVADLTAAADGRVRRTRLTRVRGDEASPSWAPDGSRIVFSGVRDGVPAVWVTTVDPAARPADGPVLVSKIGGTPAWSPDGQRIAIADLPAVEPAYNGNPLRNQDDPPPLFAEAYRLRFVDAPLPADSGARTIALPRVSSARYTAAFDRVWETLRRLYYAQGQSAAQWVALKDKYRAAAGASKDDGHKDYASTLRVIATDGASSFYRGAIARRIADDMAQNGGLITLDDLAQYRAIERRPLTGQYREYRVFSAPPPVATGAALIETLQILENYPARQGAAYFRDPGFLHHAIEAWKIRDTGPRIADPALWDVSLGPHLEPAHAAALFKRIDPSKASRPAAPSGEEGEPERIGRGTTAFAVADADGNMIAVTQTLSTWGGTFYVSSGLGFLYNNHLRLNPGSAPGRFLPLARSSSTSVPTLLFRRTAGADGPEIPALAVAAAGNNWIPASVYNIILNVVDARMPAQAAIEAPRFLIGRDPADRSVTRVQIEDRIPRAVLQDLTGRGHRFQKIGRKGEVRYGYAAAIVVDSGRREVQGGAEPRRSHGAAAPSEQ